MEEVTAEHQATLGELQRSIEKLQSKVDQLQRINQAGIDQLATRLDRIRLSTSTYLGASLAVTDLENGCRMFVDTRSRDVGVHLLTKGAWEMEYTSAFRRLLAPGQRVVDVGANLGWYSIDAAKIVGRSGRVLGVEPNAHFARLVAMSLEINGFSSFASVANAAVGDAEGVVEYCRNDDYPGSALVKPTTFPIVKIGVGDAVRVPSMTLDDLVLKTFGEHADVVKIDVEGWDGMVLKGFTKHLGGQKPVRLMMEWSSQLDRAPANRQKTSELLESFRYVAFRILQDGKPGTTRPVTWTELAADASLTNLLVLRTDDPLVASLSC